MAKNGYMAHDDPAPPLARSIGERMQACGVSGAWGENIAYGYTTAQAVFNGWYNSAGHRANIENPNWRAIGSAAATGATGTPTGPRRSAPRPPEPRRSASTAAAATARRPARRRFPCPARRRRLARPGTAARARASARQSRRRAGSAAGGVRDRCRPQRPPGQSAPPAGGQADDDLRRRLQAWRPDAEGTRVLRRPARGTRAEGRRRRFRNGKAICVWRLPGSARGKLVSAAIVVQQGSVEVHAPFRARVAS